MGNGDLAARKGHTEPVGAEAGEEHSTSPVQEAGTSRIEVAAAAHLQEQERVLAQEVDASTGHEPEAPCIGVDDSPGAAAADAKGVPHAEGARAHIQDSVLAGAAAGGIGYRTHSDVRGGRPADAKRVLEAHVREAQAEQSKRGRSAATFADAAGGTAGEAASATRPAQGSYGALHCQTPRPPTNTNRRSVHASARAQRCCFSSCFLYALPNSSCPYPRLSPSLVPDPFRAPYPYLSPSRGRAFHAHTPCYGPFRPRPVLVGPGEGRAGQAGQSCSGRPFLQSHHSCRAQVPTRQGQDPCRR